MNKKEIQNLVILMQEKWANIVLEIGKAYRNKTNVDDLVSELLNDVYAFNHFEVLYKPTLAKKQQIR